jgi:hypothetical protein
MKTMRRYYSVREGKHPKGKHLDLRSVRELFYDLYRDFDRRGYFQEAFGYTCVDAGFVQGTAGEDIEGYVYRKLRKKRLWPINKTWALYTQYDLFDMVEFLYDHISKPLKGWTHSYNNCGVHYEEFDKKSGQSEFRAQINELLIDYGDHELSNAGEIYNPVIQGTEDLFDNLQFSLDQQDIAVIVNQAISLFRRYGSTIEDRKRAVRELADVLEFLRPQIPKVLTSADENDLFKIANKFGIRHLNPNQKTDYDKKIWLDWIFYFYLATINTVVRLINREAVPKSPI